MFMPLFILILLCFLSGILLRVWLLKNPGMQAKNIWWRAYTKKILTVWLKMFGFCLVVGLLLLWLDGFIKIPKTNVLFKWIQYLTSLFFGIGVTVIQCDFIGLGFLLIPFRDKSLMKQETQIKMDKRVNQIAVWVVCIVLLVSFILDWIIRLFS